MAKQKTSKQQKETKKNSVRGKTKEPVTLSNLTFLLLSFREGLSMAEACQLTGNTPQMVAQAMLEDDKFNSDVHKAVAASNHEELKKIQELREAGKYDKAQEIIDGLSTPRTVVTWGMFGTAEDLTTEKFMEAYATVKSPKDIAVGFAVEYSEYVAFINQHTELVAMVEHLLELKMI